MPDYEIKRKPDGLHVHLDKTAGLEPELLQALQECQEGRCSCPTAEYDKLAKMDVTATPDSVDIELQAKPGTDLEAEAVRQCLDFTLTRLHKPAGDTVSHPPVVRR